MTVAPFKKIPVIFKTQEQVFDEIHRYHKHQYGVKSLEFRELEENLTLEIFRRVIEKCPEVEEIYLGRKKGVGMGELTFSDMHVLRDLTQLRVLHFSRVVGDKDFSFLDKGFEKLESLSLVCAPFSILNLQKIERLKNLRFLDLRGTYVNPDTHPNEVDNLRFVNPQLEIVFKPIFVPASG